MHRFCRTMAFGAVAALILNLLIAPPSARAESWWDRIQDLYRMPEKFEAVEQQLADSIRRSEEARAQLEATQSELASAQVEFGAAQAEMEAARAEFDAAQQRLLAENEALRQANGQLADRLAAAEAKEAARDAAAKRWTRTAIAAAALLVLYFASARLIRVAVWRRQGKSAVRDGAP